MEELTETRGWKIIENKININDCNVEIFINSKKNQQENSKEIPLKLYASPKYDLKQVIKGKEKNKIKNCVFQYKKVQKKI